MLDGYWNGMGRGNEKRCLPLISSDYGPPSKRQLFPLPNLQLLQKFDVVAQHPANEGHAEHVTTKTLHTPALQAKWQELVDTV